MIQDIGPHFLKNPYICGAKPKEEDFAVLYQDGRFCVDADHDKQTVRLPTVSLLPETLKKDLLYLFSVDDKAFFAPLSNDEREPAVSFTPNGFGRYTIQELRKKELFPKEYVYALFTAYHLLEWYNASRFCGRCGERTVHDSSERAMLCPECGKKIYPRINPAVIIGVLNGDRLLITRYRSGYANNALVAGFTEIGETLEETVQREVMEEAGLKVKNIRYYKSQPWGIAADILTGFFCEVDGDDTIRMDTSELKYAEWVKREDIGLQPTNYSLTNEMMRCFKEGKI